MGIRQLRSVRPRLAVRRAGLRREGAQEVHRRRPEVREGPSPHGQDVAGRTRHRDPRGVLRRHEGRRAEGARPLDALLNGRRAAEARARVPGLPAARERLRGGNGRRREATGGLRQGVAGSRRQKPNRDRLEGREEEAEGVRRLRKRRTRRCAQGQEGDVRAAHRVPGREERRALDRRVRGAGRFRRFARKGQRQREARASASAPEGHRGRQVGEVPVDKRRQARHDPRLLEGDALRRLASRAFRARGTSSSRRTRRGRRAASSAETFASARTSSRRRRPIAPSRISWRAAGTRSGSTTSTS